jgi:hypothetical protein
VEDRHFHREWEGLVGGATLSTHTQVQMYLHNVHPGRCGYVNTFMWLQHWERFHSSLASSAWILGILCPDDNALPSGSEQSRLRADWEVLHTSPCSGAGLASFPGSCVAAPRPGNIPAIAWKARLCWKAWGLSGCHRVSVHIPYAHEWEALRTSLCSLGVTN